MLHSPICYLLSCSYCMSLTECVSCHCVVLCTAEVYVSFMHFHVICDITVDYSCRVALVRSLSAGGMS